MNHKHLLVKCITLLYRESLIEENPQRSSDIVHNILNEIKISEVNLGISQDNDLLRNLKRTAQTMCDDPIDVRYDISDLLQRLRIDCIDDDPMFEAIKESIQTQMAQDTLLKSCVNIRRELINYFKEEEAIALLTKTANALRFNRDSVKNFRIFLQEHIQQLEPFTIDTIGVKDPAIISDVDLIDINAVQKVFSDIKTMDDGTGIMKTGWQGLNRMLRGGFRRGEEAVVGALQHNFKTGFTLSLFSHFALFNEPYLIDVKKKPLLLRISFEDDITLNFQFLYTYLKENETGEKITDLSRYTKEEMGEYITERLSATGYHIKLLRVNPSMWSYTHICNYVLELEAQGYEVHVLMLDYLYLVPTTGCVQGPAGVDVRDMFRRIRNFTNPRKITMLTPHQISTAGKQLVREGSSTDFVKDIANKGYYAGSSQIDQELDLELYIHIVKFNGASWLTIQRGKHRIPGTTNEEDLYCVLKFQPIGTIPPDINGADTSCRKVGAGAVGTKDEKPFWDE